MRQLVKATIFFMLIIFLSACTQENNKANFVHRVGENFYIGNEPYNFVGINMWYGAYLASPDSKVGDLARLREELDLLKHHGITNIRVLGASEESTLKNSISPSFQNKDGSLNEDLLTGLDIFLDELSKRDMKAVIYLNNFWEWSGGMATYISWENNGTILDPSNPKTPWPAYALFTMKFYANKDANNRYRSYISTLTQRRNSVSGLLYKEDDTIMSWQLANEPRAGYAANEKESELPEFYKWVDETAAYIKMLAPNQLVSSGNEGVTGCVNSETCFLEAHKSDNIDYLTVHLWPLNWGWINREDMSASTDIVSKNTREYLDLHKRLASELGKPLVLEEFGFPRDNMSPAADANTEYRNSFLLEVFTLIEEWNEEGSPFVGSNVWSWGGIGRAEHDDYVWRNGDKTFMATLPKNLRD